MAKEKLGTGEILSTFFDDGVYTPLLASGTVEAAHGCAGGQPVYAVCQNGGALTVKDVEKQIKVLEMAALTGNPVVTFYDAAGAKLDEGLDVLTAASRLNTAIAKVSGVVPQVAVVVGVCGATAALAAASADVCIMAEGAELFFTAPFTSAAHGDKLPGAGSADFAAKAGVAALTAKDAAEAAALAARVVTLLPGNNLAGPSVFEFEAPSAAPDFAKYDAEKAVAALVDEGSAIELFGAFGKNVYTALATVNGNAVGVVATKPEGLCRGLQHPRGDRGQQRGLRAQRQRGRSRRHPRRRPSGRYIRRCHHRQGGPAGGQGRGPCLHRPCQRRPAPGRHRLHRVRSGPAGRRPGAV